MDDHKHKRKGLKTTDEFVVNAANTAASENGRKDRTRTRSLTKIERREGRRKTHSKVYDAIFLLLHPVFIQNLKILSRYKHVTTGIRRNYTFIIIKERSDKKHHILLALVKG